MWSARYVYKPGICPGLETVFLGLKDAEGESERENAFCSSGDMVFQKINADLIWNPTKMYCLLLIKTQRRCSIKKVMIQKKLCTSKNELIINILLESSKDIFSYT